MRFIPGPRLTKVIMRRKTPGHRQLPMFFSRSDGAQLKACIQNVAIWGILGSLCSHWGVGEVDDVTRGLKYGARLCKEKWSTFSANASVGLHEERNPCELLHNSAWMSRTTLSSSWSRLLPSNLVIAARRRSPNPQHASAVDVDRPQLWSPFE